MPRPSLRTRSMKRRNLRTPGSRSVTHYHRIQKPRGARCSACGATLSGVPALPPSSMSNVAKGKKRPNRPYGGYLCSRCLSEMVRAQVLGPTVAPEVVTKDKQQPAIIKEKAAPERVMKEKHKPEKPVKEKQATEKAVKGKEEPEKAKVEKRKKTGKSK